MPFRRRRSFRRRKPRYRRRFRRRRPRFRGRRGKTSMMKWPFSKTQFTRFKISNEVYCHATAPESGVSYKHGTSYSFSFPVRLNDIFAPYGNISGDTDPFRANMAKFYDNYIVHKTVVIVRANVDDGTDIVYWTVPARSTTEPVINTAKIEDLGEIKNLKIHGHSDYSADIQKHPQKKFSRVIKMRNFIGPRFNTDPTKMHPLMGVSPDTNASVWLHIGYTTTTTSAYITPATVDFFQVELVHYCTLSQRDSNV